MIRILSILLIIILPLIVFSQSKNEVNPKKFFLGVDAGINISKLKNDSLTLKNGYSPYIGIYTKYNVYNNLYLKASASYSIKSSTSLTPDIKIKNQYIDLNFTPQYQIFGDFYIQAGVSYSNIISSRHITRNGSNKNGLQYENINGYNSEFNLLAGLEFRLHDNTNFKFNFTIPLGENNTPNFQLGINILLLNRNTDKPNHNKIRRAKAKQQIVQIKNSVLLVRLSTYASSIKALQEIGANEKAIKLKNRQKAINQQIVKEFKENFDFCDVQFFFSNNSSNIKDHNFKNVFLNDSLQIDSSIKVSTKNFFIAEFGDLDQDTTKSFAGYDYRLNDEGVMEEVETYNSTSMGSSFYTLKIMDNNFVQLSRPFPFYVKVSHPIILRWTFKETIMEMNHNLKWYYSLHK